MELTDELKEAIDNAAKEILKHEEQKWNIGSKENPYRMYTNKENYGLIKGIVELDENNIYFSKKYGTYIKLIIVDLLPKDEVYVYDY